MRGAAEDALLRALGIAGVRDGAILALLRADRAARRGSAAAPEAFQNRSFEWPNDAGRCGAHAAVSLWSVESLPRMIAAEANQGRTKTPARSIPQAFRFTICRNMYARMPPTKNRPCLSTWGPLDVTAEQLEAVLQ